jgi:hypothetical protein
LHIFFEDDTKCNGPFSIELYSNSTIINLKKSIADKFGIELKKQNWIKEKRMLNKDWATLEQEGIVNNGQKLFLYIQGEKSEDDLLTRTTSQTGNPH